MDLGRHRHEPIARRREISGERHVDEPDVLESREATNVVVSETFDTAQYWSSSKYAKPGGRVAGFATGVASSGAGTDTYPPRWSSSPPPHPPIASNPPASTAINPTLISSLSPCVEGAAS